MKFCKKCDTTKALGEFHNARSRPDGKTSQCKACFAKYRAERREEAAAWQREYRRTATDIVRETDRRTRIKNLDARRKRNKQWYARNTEYAREMSRRWMRQNPEKDRARAKRSYYLRVARMKNARIYEVSAREITLIMSRQCAVPACDAPSQHLDHIIPIARGGMHSVGNLQGLCASHNIMKGAKVWVEFLAYLAFRKSVLAA